MVVLGRVDIIFGFLLLLFLSLPLQLFFCVPLELFPLPLAEITGDQYKGGEKGSGETDSRAMAASLGSGTFGNTDKRRLARTGGMSNAASMAGKGMYSTWYPVGIRSE